MEREIWTEMFSSLLYRDPSIMTYCYQLQCRAWHWQEPLCPWLVKYQLPSISVVNRIIRHIAPSLSIKITLLQTLNDAACLLAVLTLSQSCINIEQSVKKVSKSIGRTSFHFLHKINYITVTHST